MYRSPFFLLLTTLLALQRVCRPGQALAAVKSDPKEVARYKGTQQWHLDPMNDRMPEGVYERQRAKAQECARERIHSLRGNDPRTAATYLILLACPLTKSPGSADAAYKTTVRERWHEIVDASSTWLESEDPLIKYLASCTVLSTAALVGVDATASVQWKNIKAIDRLLITCSNTLALHMGRSAPPEAIEAVIARGQDLLSSARRDERGVRKSCPDVGDRVMCVTLQPD